MFLLYNRELKNMVYLFDIFWNILVLTHETFDCLIYRHGTDNLSPIR
jgi:hypothetical protein